MSPASYENLMRLWHDYEAGLDDHYCPKEEFVRCDICEKSWEARTMLGNQLDLTLELLKKYHDALGELTLSVVQEVELPRPERVQKAVLKALALEKPGSE